MKKIIENFFEQAKQRELFAIGAVSHGGKCTVGVYGNPPEIAAMLGSLLKSLKNQYPDDWAFYKKFILCVLFEENCDEKVPEQNQHA